MRGVVCVGEGARPPSILLPRATSPARSGCAVKVVRVVKVVKVVRMVKVVRRCLVLKKVDRLKVLVLC